MNIVKPRNRHLQLGPAVVLCVAGIAVAWGQAPLSASAPEPNQQSLPSPSSPSSSLPAALPSTSGNAAPLTLTLQDALARARANEPQFHAAQTDLGIAQQQVVQGRSGLLPAVNFNTEFLYTQGNGTSTGRFIASNGVHEYVSQGDVHEEMSLQTVAEYRRTLAAQAVAKARADIAARGLVVAVVKAYYGLAVAQRKYATMQTAYGEAQSFLGISQKLEKGGEVAHSDTIKAEIQFRNQERAWREASLEMDRSRLELAVLVSPDFSENFSVVDDLQIPLPLPAFREVERMAADSNPDVAAAVATVKQADQGVAIAWNGFLPTLSLDYFYGIDANHFATYTGPIKNLGYAATATLQLPIWNWGANRAQVKQADLERQQARVELSFTQRQVLANLRSFYAEAQTARDELDSLAQSARLAEDSLRLTTLRYRAGESSVLEVVDAQNTLTAAKSAFDDGQARYRIAVANLQTLTGAF
jgi:outer membrane protein TolC